MSAPGCPDQYGFGGIASASRQSHEIDRQNKSKRVMTKIITLEPEGSACA
jgi:hypothetical protein